MLYFGYLHLKSVGRILNLSRTHFVSDLRHQHRCHQLRTSLSPIWPTWQTIMKHLIFLTLSYWVVIILDEVKLANFVLILTVGDMSQLESLILKFPQSEIILDKKVSQVGSGFFFLIRRNSPDGWSLDSIEPTEIKCQTIMKIIQSCSWLKVHDYG